MDSEKLEEILRLHKQWIDTNRKEGVCANLENADLKGAYLNDAELSSANFTEENFNWVSSKDAALMGSFKEKSSNYIKAIY